MFHSRFSESDLKRGKARNKSRQPNHSDSSRESNTTHKIEVPLRHRVRIFAPRSTRQERAPKDTHQERAPKDTHQERVPKDTHQERAPKDTHQERAPKDTHQERAPKDTCVRSNYERDRRKKESTNTKLSDVEGSTPYRTYT
eukprot:TRINITY_DN351_c0_g1_i12.p1 TRINITY_DN351_c0_g1~~TRINITY_DN351_c0_g1_i12.p1  ORF type:complete len:142 (+),score=8.88 TRINITY_DN351_c0_g1_i12:1260-1685(+)